MHMIRSSDGEHIRNNNNDYRRGDAVFRQVGSSLFGSDGSHALDTGRTVYKNSNAIHIYGNELRTSTGLVYRLEGTTLYCSNGQRWYGVSSMSDAKAVASMNL